MPDDRKALLYGISAVLMWSTVATGFKLGLRVMTPVQLLFAGACVSAVIFAAVAARRGWPRKACNLREGFLFALMNPVLYYLLLFESYDRLPAQIAQPLNYTWAIMLALLAVPLLGQKLSPRMIVGILIGYLGVLVLLSQGRFDALPAVDLTGVALALGSTVVWAAYWLQNARSRTEPSALMATSFLIAVPVLGLICAIGARYASINRRGCPLRTLGGCGRDGPHVSALAASAQADDSGGPNRATHFSLAISVAGDDRHRSRRDHPHHVLDWPRDYRLRAACHRQAPGGRPLKGKPRQGEARSPLS